MNKTATRIVILVSCFILCIFSTVCNVCAVAETPVFDSGFDNGKGALFANGTPIVISKSGNKTIASWATGSVAIPETVKVFGGGNAGTSYETTKIKMVSGTVSALYGGGFSTNPILPAIVGTSDVIVEGGTVNASAYAGGLLYTKVTDANITQSGGKITFLVGGGASSATVAGVTYNTGTEAEPQNSGTIVKNSTVTVIDGVVDYVFGGGQGYSYTVNTTVNINGGSALFVTAGGSNGLTGTTTVDITGGVIDQYQSVNRGTVNKVNTTIKGGTVDTFFIGSEDAADATGKLTSAKIDLIKGDISTLNTGKSNNVPLVITKPAYDISFVPGIIETNNITTGDVTSVNFEIALEAEQIDIIKVQTKDIVYLISTNPSGYENLFESSLIKWSSADENVASVKNGTIKGVGEGSTIVTATLNDQTASIVVNVNDISIIPIIIIILILCLFLLFVILSTCSSRRRRQS